MGDIVWVVLYLVTFLLCVRMSVGDIVWPVLETNLSGVVTVSEEEITSTNKLVRKQYKLQETVHINLVLYCQRI